MRRSYGLGSVGVEWPAAFYAQLAGTACPFCEGGRPAATPRGVRYFEGAVSDAHLVRADIQRGLSVVAWRGRHVVEPTELSDAEAAAHGGEVLRVARAIQAVLEPVKLNCDVLGNSVPHLHTHLVPRYADDPRPRAAGPAPLGSVGAIPNGARTLARGSWSA